MSKLFLNQKNFEHLSFVLIDDEERIIAVIIPKVDEDCLGLVAKAIMEDFTGTISVKFDKIELDDEEFTTQVDLEVTMYEEDEDEPFIRNFELVRTAVYHS